MEQIDKIILEKQLRKEKKLNERAELIKFFHTTLRNKNKKPFPAKMLAIKLSHLEVKDLYYMISVYKDIQNRKGNESAQKWFWFSIKK